MWGGREGEGKGREGEAEGLPGAQWAGACGSHASALFQGPGRQPCSCQHSAGLTLRAPTPPYPWGPRSPSETGCMSAEPTMFELTQVLNIQWTSREHVTARRYPDSGALRAAWPHILPDSHVHPSSPTQSCPEPRAWQGAGTPSSALPLSSPVWLHLRQGSAWLALLHQVKAPGPAVPRKGCEAGPAETPVPASEGPRTSAGEMSDPGLVMTVGFKMMLPRK